MFDLEKMTCFADDISVITQNKNLALLIVDMEKSLEAIIKWLKKSGLKVNYENTELCLFHGKNQPKTRLMINLRRVTKQRQYKSF